MACENLVGVKNILLTFFDCDTDTRIGPISHKQATDELPTIKSCPWTNEALPNGFTKRTAAQALMSLNVIRDLRIPLAYYQGCVSISIQIEYENGLVYSALDGGVTGDEQSDTHEIQMELTFTEIDELLPPGSLAQAA